MIDLNLAALAADMRETLAASHGARRCAARALESGHHLTLLRTPDRSFPSVFHCRLEVALHHTPPAPAFLDAAPTDGAAGSGETAAGEPPAAASASAAPAPSGEPHADRHA